MHGGHWSAVPHTRTRAAGQSNDDGRRTKKNYKKTNILHMHHKNDDGDDDDDEGDADDDDGVGAGSSIR